MALQIAVMLLTLVSTVCTVVLGRDKLKEVAVWLTLMVFGFLVYLTTNVLTNPRLSEIVG